MVSSAAPYSSAMAVDEEDHLIASITERDEFVRSAGYGEEKLSSVLVMGSVLCKSCGGATSESASGATVVVKCRRGKARIRTRALTDKYGDFTIELPSEVHAWPRLEKSCRVRVLRLSRKSACYPRFSGQPTPLKLSSVGNGVRAYDAGVISIKKNKGDSIACS
ncbi:hypothetical protein EJ110_NYTH27831 [Nymphaea thermarum]|nr:hypothetical protein EJ110_NYTH27831 [Nymphaea thermarum]